MDVSLSLSLWSVLLMLSCCGNIGSHEEDLTLDDDSIPTATPDYDYNATFDYYYFYVTSPSGTSSKAAGIGPLTLGLLLGLAFQQMWN